MDKIKKIYEMTSPNKLFEVTSNGENKVTFSIDTFQTSLVQFNLNYSSICQLIDQLTFWKEWSDEHTKYRRMLNTLEQDLGKEAAKKFINFAKDKYMEGE